MASVAASGPISFTDIQAVMGGSGPVSMQDYIQSAATGYAKGVPGIGNANISIADFQGKSKALMNGLQYRIFRKRYVLSNAASSGTAGTGSYGGGGGAAGVTVTEYGSALGPNSSATVASGTVSGGAGTGFGAGGGGTGVMGVRYITFQYGNSNGGVGRCMNLGGVRAYASSSGANIINSSMAVTVLDNYGSGFVAANMVDNNDSTMYHSSCGSEYPWVKVDLGSEQPIYKVELTNRGDCCRSRIAGLTLQLQNGSGTVIYTSGLCALNNGATNYQEGMLGYLFYSWWPALNTTPYGSDTSPYTPPTFTAGQGASGFVYIQPPTISTGTISARYVRFEYGNGNGGVGRYLQSTGVRVYGSLSGANVITSSMTVTASSTFNSSYLPAYLVDNVDTTTYISSSEEYPTVTVDLGSEQPIHRIELMNRYDGTKGRLVGVRLVLLNASSTIVHTSGMISDKNGAYVYQSNENAFMYYTFWPALSTLPIGSDTVPYPATEFFTNASTSYTFPLPGTAKLLLMGGGGGGGSNAGTNSRGGGGGGAGYLQSYFIPVTSGTVATLTVGGPGTSDVSGGTTSAVINSITYTAAGGGNGGTTQTGGAGSAAGGTGGSAGAAGAGGTQTSAASIGHLTNDGGYFADDPTWFDSRTENYPPGLVTNFTNINTATGGIVPADSSWLTYSVEWFGYFYATVTGTYTFYTNTDDASYLWVGASALSGYTTGNCLVNSSGIHGVQERSGTISLTAGTYYPIRFQFGQNTGGDGCALSFSAPGITRTYDLTGYVYYGMGTYLSFPINHARLLRATNSTTVDRSYYVNVAGTATPTYCLMDSKWDGGGWMMMMKSNACAFNQTAVTSITENTSTTQTSRYMGSIPLPDGFVNGSSISVTMTGTRGPSYGYIEGGSYIQDTTDTIRFIQLVYGDAGRSGTAVISGTATTPLKASMFPLKAYKYSAYPGWYVYSMTLNVTITYSNTSAGSVFPYSSTYWTDNTTTLNTGSTDRTAADAKFAVMNQTPVKDVLALWPDAGTTGGSISQTDSWSWMVNNYYYGGARVTPIIGFSSSNSRDATTHFLNTSDQTSFAGYSASIWSQEPGAKRHVFGGGSHLSSNVNVRWGFLWNNESDFASIDVTGGIGMSQTAYSAGDYYGGGGTQALNRSMRVEMYGR